MEYNILKLKDLEGTSPKSGKVNIEKLSEEDKKQYMDLYNLYRELFTEYIIGKLGLGEFDKEIANSGYNFKPVDEENMDIYQYFSSEKLKYFFIRNNIYLEKLTKEEAEFFRKRLREGNRNLDTEAEKMVERTYRKVILEDVLQNGEKCRVLFGPDSSSFLSDNSKIVIGFRYDEFYNKGIDDDVWFDRFMRQTEFINSIVSKMKESFEQSLPNETSILLYDDVSIMEREEKGEER